MKKNKILTIVRKLGNERSSTLIEKVPVWEKGGLIYEVLSFVETYPSISHNVGLLLSNMRAISLVPVLFL